MGDREGVSWMNELGMDRDEKMKKEKSKQRCLCIREPLAI